LRFRRIAADDHSIKRCYVFVKEAEGIEPSPPIPGVLGSVGIHLNFAAMPVSPGLSSYDLRSKTFVRTSRGLRTFFSLASVGLLLFSNAGLARLSIIIFR
jgi:hypothetical protein